MNNKEFKLFVERQRLDNKLLDYYNYPFNKELRKEIDWLISKDEKGKYFKNELSILYYKTRMMDDFYFHLFKITDFDSWKYVNVQKALADKDSLKRSGIAVTKNFLKLNSHFRDKKKSKNIISRFINNEFFRLYPTIKLKEIKSKRAEASQMKMRKEKLKIYLEIIDFRLANPKKSERGCCNRFYTESLSSDFESFKVSFRAWYENPINYNKYPNTLKYISQFRGNINVKLDQVL